MTDTVAQKIRDDLVAQDVRYRRVDASVRREIDARINQLGRDLVNLLQTIDPHGAIRPAARQRRLQKLNKESGVMIRTAYSEINGMLKSALRRVSKVETNKVVQIVEENLP